MKATIACPECGKKRPDGRTETWCVPCANTGHNFRLMTQVEIAESAEVLRLHGYEEKANLRQAIADSMATIPTGTKKKPGGLHASPQTPNYEGFA